MNLSESSSHFLNLINDVTSYRFSSLLFQVTFFFCQTQQFAIWIKKAKFEFINFFIFSYEKCFAEVWKHKLWSYRFNFLLNSILAFSIKFVNQYFNVSHCNKILHFILLKTITKPNDKINNTNFFGKILCHPILFERRPKEK